MRTRILTFFLVMCWWTPISAEELVMEFKGLDLIANIERAGAKSLKGKNVVLILHDSLSSTQTPMVAGIQQRLNAQGQISLAINLSYTLDQRAKDYDCKIEQNHRYQDAFEEIDVWVKWLTKEGVRRVVLVGHGRGANQVALYLRNHPKHKKIKKAVLISPLNGAFNNIERDYEKKYGRALQTYLGKAQKLIADGEADALMVDVPFMSCKRATVTALTFANYMSPNPEFDTVSILSSLTGVSVLTVVGEYDPAAYDIQSNLQSISAVGGIMVETVPGAGSQFEGDYLFELADKLVSFLQNGKKAGR